MLTEVGRRGLREHMEDRGLKDEETLLGARRERIQHRDTQELLRWEGSREQMPGLLPMCVGG